MHFSSNTLDYMFDIWQALPITLLLVLCPHNLAYLLHQQKLFYLLIGKNNVFFFLSGPFLRRTRFMRVIGVGFTSKCSNAIFLGNSGSHAILKVFLACSPVRIPQCWHYQLLFFWQAWYLSSNLPMVFVVPNVWMKCMGSDGWSKKEPEPLWWVNFFCNALDIFKGICKISLL